MSWDIVLGVGIAVVGGLGASEVKHVLRLT